ncbi:MAG: deoxyribose-phosphate aldolase [Ignavibacteriales bacterium]|nr:deoxyribose-phosphate aldolase [Ignavibacteriales bacterium]
MNTSTTLKTLAKMIDHSLLHPTLTDQAIANGCELAIKYRVATACVKPYAVELARTILNGSDVGVCAVVSFPHGNSTTPMKLRETEEALSNGATEIDAVVNIGKVLGGDWNYLSEEIGTINETVTGHHAILKVIFENDYLQDTHIIKLCEICASASVAYVKTSTGYGFVKQANGMYNYAGATDHHLGLMRTHSPASVGIKAAGGVRTLDDLLRVRELGVSRIGAVTTEAILQDAERRGFR